MKVCSKCGVEKDESEFEKCNNVKCGLRAECKKCKALKRKPLNTDQKQMQALNAKEHRLLNKDKINKRKRELRQLKDKEIEKKRRKEYREKNVKKIKEMKKRDYEKNKDKYKELNKEYAIKNKESIYLNKKKYYDNNIEKIKAYRKRYYLDSADDFKEKRIEYYNQNKKDILKKIAKYNKDKLLNDPAYKMCKNISSCFRSALKCRNIKKSQTLFQYTGIAYADYITYFENNFPAEFAEITVKGKYHIDHIIPCAVYDFNNAEHIKLCWQPQNLRIIPAAENLSKSNKLDIELIHKHKIEHLLPKNKGVKI